MGAKNVIAILDLDNSKLEFLSRTTLKENRRVMLGKDWNFVYIDVVRYCISVKLYVKHQLHTSNVYYSKECSHLLARRLQPSIAST